MMTKWNKIIKIFVIIFEQNIIINTSGCLSLHILHIYVDGCL